MNRNPGFQWGLDLEDMHDDAACPRGDERTAARRRRDVHGKPRPAARVGGMHCRRNKRWTWGHGGAARVTNLQAFARLAAVICAFTSSAAFAVQIQDLTLLTVADPGNPGNPSSPGTFGSVAYTFQISANETTNAQYAAFLNAADPTGAQPNGIYNSQMGSNSLGGINFDSGAASGSKYSVKSGFASRPVNFVSWTSAARFVNFYTTNGVTTETGSYDMSNLAAGRLPTAQYVLPSLNEYYKASFYTGSGSTYTLYQTNSNSTPTASGAGTATPNTANFGGAAASPASTGPLDVGSFTGTTSHYGLFDALGNVTEYTDRLNPTGTGATRVGGNWNMPSTDLSLVNATAEYISFGGLSANQNNLGFRIAAVPEPDTIFMAVMGGVTMLGVGWTRRRKSARRVVGVAAG